MPILEQLPLRRVALRVALDAMAAFPVRRARTESVGLVDAEGRTLSAKLCAREQVPAFRRSRVDGYAVVASDVRAASRQQPVHLRLSGEVMMGAQAHGQLMPGQAIRLPTGGALPSGASGVVMIEDTDLRGDTVIVFDGSDCAEYITEAGSDVNVGDVLFSAGTVLSPAALGLLAAGGITEVPVYIPPAVGIIVTGDELAACGAALRPGQVRDINGVALPAAIAAMGFAPRPFGRVEDDRAKVESLFRRALQKCDAIVISGGSSVGERDYTPAIVAAAGSPGVIVHGIKAKPGRPALLAMIGEQPVFGLPGNPVSALVVLEAVVKPVLLRMFDKSDTSVPVRAMLDNRLVLEPELEHRIPVRLIMQAGEVHAQPLLGTSAQMHILGLADGMLVVALGVGTIDAGTWVDIMPFSRSRSLR